MTDFIRLPPDSTGKRISARKFAALNYTAGSVNFVPQMSLVGNISGAVATVEMLQSGNATAGEIYITYALDSASFQVGETFTADGNPAATVSTISDLYAQQGVISDPDHLHHMLHIDAYGAAFTRFNEGSPRLDAFGRMAVSESTNIFNFSHAYGSRIGDGADDLWSEINGTAATTYQNTYASTVLSVGTANNDAVKLTSNQHFTYFPGISTALMVTLTVGDTGKANVVREWGMFTDTDGVFFRLSGTTLQVVRRSSASGSIVEEVVNQQNFNSDKVNGAGGVLNISGVNLDVTKLNIYFIDYQWLGAGRVRMGMVAPSGERLVCHAFENANKHPRVYMATGTLPFRVNQYNTGVSASTSELTLTCGVITLGASAENVAALFSARRGTSPLAKTGITTAALISGFRAAATINTFANRKLLVPSAASVYVTQPTYLSFYEGTSVTNGSWVQADASDAYEINATGTTYVAGKLLGSRILAAGTHEITLPHEVSYSNSGACLRADGQPGRPLLIVASAVSAATDVHISLRWLEFG